MNKNPHHDARRPRPRFLRRLRPQSTTLTPKQLEAMAVPLAKAVRGMVLARRLGFTPPASADPREAVLSVVAMSILDDVAEEQAPSLVVGAKIIDSLEVSNKAKNGLRIGLAIGLRLGMQLHTHMIDEPCVQGCPAFRADG